MLRTGITLCRHAHAHAQRAVTAATGACASTSGPVVSSTLHMDVRTSIKKPIKLGRNWQRRKGVHGFKRKRRYDVVLLKTMEGLGKEGETISVKKGRARNDLVPSGAAVFNTPLNRHLYAKDEEELAKEKVSVGDKYLCLRLSKWKKRLEKEEILLLRKPGSKINFNTFDIVETVKQKFVTNIPAFCFSSLQRIQTKGDNAPVFTREAFLQTMADLSTMDLSEPIASRSITDFGDYVLTFDLTAGLDVDPETENYPGMTQIRFSITDDRDRAKIKETAKMAKRNLTSRNPRAMLYKARKGVTGVEWTGFSTLS